MKLILLLSLLLTLGLLWGCNSTGETIEPAPVTSTKPVSGTTTTGTTSPGSTTTTSTGQLQGMFVSNVHATSGAVRLVDQGGKRTLVFENFRTDGGPDLRIYLAENTSLRNFIEVSLLPATSGNFTVDLPASADPAKQRFVLVWCKAFSVLFGNAELK